MLKPTKLQQNYSELIFWYIFYGDAALKSQFWASFLYRKIKEPATNKLFSGRIKRKEIMYNLILDAILLSSRNISSMNIASVVQKKLKFQKKLLFEGVGLYLRS